MKKVFLKNSQNSKENTSVGVKHKEIPTQVFSCKLCKISKYIFFIEHHRQLHHENMSLNQLNILKNHLHFQCSLGIFLTIVEQHLISA